MVEEWRSVEQKGVTWLVSDGGAVKVPSHSYTYTRTRSGRQQQVPVEFPERTLSPYTTKSGYLEVAAMKHGRRVKCLLHRLVGLAFVPGHADGLTINHIDGNKKNNAPSNLEWVSLARNSQHAWESGLVDLRGEKHPQVKLTSKRVTYIRRLLAKGIPAHTLAIVAGVCNETITKIGSGRAWPTVTPRQPVQLT